MATKPTLPVSKQGFGGAATMAGGLNDFYKSALSPEQYAKLIEPLQYTANENFGGKVQDFQVQLLTPLDTSQLSAPKQLEFNGAYFDGTKIVKTPNVSLVGGGGPDAEGNAGSPPTGYQSAPELINGIPVITNYDLNGKVTGYTGDNTVTTWTGGKDRLVGNWNASGTPSPTGLRSGDSEFSNFTGAIGDLLSSDAAKVAALGVGAMYFGPGLLGSAETAAAAGAGAGGAGAGGLTAFDAMGANMVTGALPGAGALGAVPSALDVLGADITTGAMAGVAPTVAGGVAGAAAPSLFDTAKTALSSLTNSDIANLAKAGVSIAGLAGAVNAIPNTGGGGLLTMQPQDRSGVSVGSANYSPEYYQQVQAAYNKLMPATAPQQPRDVTTDLKNWYENKYSPAAVKAPMPVAAPAPVTMPIATPVAAPAAAPVAAAPTGMLTGAPTAAAPAPAAPAYTSYTPAQINTFLSQNPTADLSASIKKYNADPGAVLAERVKANSAEAAPAYAVQAGATPQPPLYTALGSASDPQAIAAAYKQFIGSPANDTVANQQAVNKYLINLGINPAVIGQAYGLFKG
jgi:hypothetical protein